MAVPAAAVLLLLALLLVANRARDNDAVRAEGVPGRSVATSGVADGAKRVGRGAGRRMPQALKLRRTVGSAPPAATDESFAAALVGGGPGAMTNGDGGRPGMSRMVS